MSGGAPFQHIARERAQNAGDLSTAGLASLGIDVTDSMSALAIQGTTSVIDGDTIEILGERIRLDASDALESPQLCLDAASRLFRYRKKPVFALVDMIERSSVSCHPPPLYALEVDEIPQPQGLFVQEVEALAREAAAQREDHAVAARRWHFQRPRTSLP